MSTARDVDYAEEAPSDITPRESLNGNGARYGRGAGSPHEPATLRRASAADHGAAVNAKHSDAISYYMFVFAATLVAAAYAATFLIWGDVESPQLAVAVCLVFAAAFLWVWKGLFGKVVACLAFGYALYEYGRWFVETRQIKANTGRAEIPGAGLMGNVLYGASWFEPLALLAVIALLSFSVYFLTRDIKTLTGTRAAKRADGDEDNHGSVGTIQRASHY